MLNYLWIADIGCRMWSLPCPQHSLYAVYQAPTKELLDTTNIDQRLSRHRSSEIGTLIRELSAGEIQALWAIFSPVVIKESQARQVMQHLCKQALSKQFYESIRIAAFNCFAQSWAEPQMTSDMKLKHCMCILNFGVALYDEHKLLFNPVLTVPTLDDINERIWDMKQSMNNSSLPDHSCQSLLKDYLLNLRKQSLLGTVESLDRDSQGNYTRLQMCQEVGAIKCLTK